MVVSLNFRLENNREEEEEDLEAPAAPCEGHDHRTVAIELSESAPRCRGPALQGYLAHKKHPPVGPYSSPLPRALWWSYGGGGVLMPCTNTEGKMARPSWIFRQLVHQFPAFKKKSS